MANPPVNRRPGVDADIFQGERVRGYDVPAGDQTMPPPVPCDLIVSNGKSQIDQSVSNLIFANRTDSIGQPIFVMALGADETAPIGTVNFHIGEEADPNGLISGVGPGSLYASYGDPSLWQLQADDTTWVQISDELGGENLEETLAIGNFTGAENIVVSSGGSKIVGEDGLGGAAGTSVLVEGGPALGAVGDGGAIQLLGGTSVGGATGGLSLASPAATVPSATGAISMGTGDSLFGGGSGDVSISTGDAGAAGVGGSPGTISVAAGSSFTTGSLVQSGGVSVTAGFSQTDGAGGRIFIRAGNATGSDTPIIVATTAGQGGEVRIGGGNSASTRAGGAVIISGGQGGSAGGSGGNINLNPGPGGGGFPDGIVNADGIFQSSNIKRGDGNPNSLLVAGDEGDVFQRTTGALGQLWLNTNGQPTGWKQIGLAGGFIDAFTKIQFGYISPAGDNPGVVVEDNIADVGLYEDIDVSLQGGGTANIAGNAFAPNIFLSAPANNDYAVLDTADATTLRIQHRPLAVFKFDNTSVAIGWRGWVGLSTTDGVTMVGSDLPGGEYIGFQKPDGNSSWRFLSRGASILAGTGVAIGDTDNEPNYLVIDASDPDNISGNGFVVLSLLDKDLNLVASQTVGGTNLPTHTSSLRPAIGVRSTGANAALRMYNASVVTEADVLANAVGGGAVVSAPALNEVLINGNETGSTLVLVNQGSGLLGVTDDNLGDGASFSIFGGATTLAGNDTGSVTVGSGNAFGGGAESVGASTGTGVFGSGFQLAATSQGDTGAVNLQTGDHAGTDGTTGDLVLRTGGFTNGAAGARTQGDVLIAPGSFTPNTATVTGEIIIKGGSTSLTGVTGGDVTITSGENSSASGDTGGIVVETFPANTAGDSGNLEVKTGDAGGVSGDSGNLDIETGDAPGAGNTGAVAIVTGDAANGAAGPMFVGPGSSTVGNGADITVVGGDTTAGGAFGGNIVLTPGTGAGGDGVVQVNGKLTVTGLIDPTGLLLDGQAAQPTPVGAGQGLLWVDDTAVPSRLFFVDDTGTPHDISTGGSATTLGALTDVTLAGPVAGEVLTFNGAQWVNLPGVGGSPLATILGIGNTTGGTAGGIVVSDTAGDRIASDGDLVLDPAVAAGNAVVIDGLRWPESDGAAGFVLTTNGAGVLSFQPGGAGAGLTFAEAFAQMQWGTLEPPPDTGVVSELNGAGILHDHSDSANAGSATFQRAQGLARQMSGVAPNVAEAGFITSSGVTRPDNLGLYVWKFEISNTADVRLFLGLTDGTRNDMVSSDAPATPVNGYVGLGYSTSVPDAGFVFWHNNAAGVGTRVPSGVPADTNVHYFVLDASTVGQFTLSLYDQDFTLEGQTIVAASAPSGANVLSVMGALMPIGAPNEALFLYSCTAVHRADLLGTLGGGGGNQDLFSVLGFGNDTGGIPIQGTDNAGGSGSSLDLLGGSSTGGGGDGGDVQAATGSPDPAGNGDGGDFQVATASGAGTGDGGTMALATGTGGAAGGDGGDFQVATGGGGAAGSGGMFEIALGNGGAAGGGAGFFDLLTGSGTGGNAVGGRIDLRTGDGFGSGDGGGFLFLAGDGGAGGGDGGSMVFTAGTGMGGGVDGTFTFNGDTTINGKLTVTGLIDPTGLLMTSSGVAPFTPVGTEGGIWVNAAGELVFTNTGGDLNLSTAIGGGMTFLDALLTAGYGFLGPGNPAGGIQAYGVYGSSVVQAVDPGPPPASITFSEDTDGPFLNLAVAASPGSEAFVGTADLFVRRDQRFRARFKFQVTSPAHTNERIFIGFTDDPALTTPSTQLSMNDPAALEYVGLREDLAGFNLEFVARGSGGAMVPVFALPTDALVHYLEIDATDAGGDVTFTVYAADGVTVEATHTEPSSFLLPTLANALRPFTGIFTDNGTTPRGIDFYFSTVITRADVVDAVTGAGSGGTPTLAAVLGAGNNAGAINIEADGGIDGGMVTLALAGGAAGGAGSPATLALEAESGDDGGNTSLLAGAGAGAGGDGGDLDLEAAPGAGTGTGGDASLLAGDGGATGDAGSLLLGAGTPGLGGAFGDALLRGDKAAPIPPALAGLTDGATILIAASSGGATGGSAGALRGESTGAGRGGQAFLSGGDAAGGSNAVGGGVTLSGGTGDGTGGGGNISVATGTGGATGSGGLLSLLTASAVGGSGGDGGDITIQAGAGDGAGDAGSIHLLGDGATAVAVPSPGGDVQLVGALSVGNANGGRVVAEGGSALLGGSAQVAGGDAVAGSGLIGGTASLISGTGDGAAAGGFVLVRGGQGGATGDGGDAQIRGGGATGGANTGGDVRLIPGSGPGGDGLVRTEGTLRVEAPIDPTGPGFQHGAAVLPGGPGPFPIGFNVPFASPPATVIITLETSPPVPYSIAPGSIGGGGFTLEVGGPLAPGDRLHWVAYL